MRYQKTTILLTGLFILEMGLFLTTAQGQYGNTTMDWEIRRQIGAEARSGGNAIIEEGVRGYYEAKRSRNEEGKEMLETRDEQIIQLQREKNHMPLSQSDQMSIQGRLNGLSRLSDLK